MPLSIHDMGYEPDDLKVTISEMLVATADQSDEALDRNITEVLRTLRERMQMDVVFCSEFVDGQRVMRQVAADAARPVVSAGQSDRLEESWCHHVVKGRLPGYLPDTSQHPLARTLAAALPFSVGTHISTPIVLSNGQVYGTLCSFTFSPQDNPNPDDLKTLEMTARLTAMRIEAGRDRAS